MADELRETEKGSLELRMAARGKLADRPPVFFFKYVSPNRDTDGKLLPPLPCDDARACRVGANLIHREPGETYAAFEARALVEWRKIIPMDASLGYPICAMIPPEAETKPKSAAESKPTGA